MMQDLCPSHHHGGHKKKNCSLNTIKAYQDLETSIQGSSWGLGPWLCPLPAPGLEPMNVSELPSVHLSNRDSKHLPHLFVLKIKSDHASPGLAYFTNYQQYLGFFFFQNFLCRSFFKVFIEFVAILLLFYVLVFGHEAYGILPSQPGIKPATSALESESVSHSVMFNSLLSQGL